MKKVIFFLVFLFVLLYPLPLSLNPVFANYACSKTGTPLLNGLASAPNLTQNLVTSSGVCVIDPRAAFTPQLIPTYDNLKSVYYTQAKSTNSITKHELATGDKTQADIPFTDTGDSIYHINGNLTLSSNNIGTHTGIVFIEGNLNINGNYCYGSTCPAGVVSPLIGTVFVVKKDVNIDQNITRIDAVIITEGTICTAYNGSSCPLTNVTALQLIINGSLISLNQSKSIQFRRVLVDNSSQPSEKINHQIKYLVILRHLFSDTFQRWSETQ